MRRITWSIIALASLLAVGWGGLPAAAQDQPPKEDIQKKSVGSRIEVTDGKIVITDEKGDRREIEIPGARSIVVQRGAQRIVQDGQDELKVFGKAIVVGPDGETVEIDLSEVDDPEGAIGKQDLLMLEKALIDFDDANRPFALFSSPADNRFFIGVHCVPVDETLAAHLRLTPGFGLVVKFVSPGSPAERGGIMANDIILNANDKELATQEQLAEIINQAGKNDEEVSLTLIREGRDVQIKLKPQEREPAAIFGDGVDRPGPLGVEGIGPGIIRLDHLLIPQLTEEELGALNEKLGKWGMENAPWVDELKKKALEMQSRLQESIQNLERDQNWKAGVDDQLKEWGAENLRDRIKELREELAAARAELKALREKMAEMVREQVQKELESRKDK